MKRILVLSLLTCTLLSACGPSQEQSYRHRKPGYNGPQPAETGTAAQPSSNVVVPPVPPEQKPAPAPTPAPEAEATPTPAPAPAHKAYPTAKPVPGKTGYVTSPYSPDAGLIDVRGYPPGTEVKDPWADGKIFLVP